MSNWVLEKGSRVWNMHSRVSRALCIGNYVCHGHNDQLPVQKAPGSLHIVVMEICPQLLSTCSKACMCLRSWEQLVVLLLQLHVRIGRVFDVICPKQTATLTNWHGEWSLVTWKVHLFVFRHTMLWTPFSFPQVSHESLVLGIFFLGDNGPALNESLSSILFQ